MVFSSVPNTPPTAVADTGNATEKGGTANGSGGSPAIGNVLGNDTDPDVGDTKTVTAVSFGAIAGMLGTAPERRTWQSRAQRRRRLHLYGQRDRRRGSGIAAIHRHADRRFNYTMRDTAGATSSTTLTVTIHGADDAPVLAAQTTASRVVGAAFSLALPAGTFTDVDDGDTLTYFATTRRGTPLTWLRFNAVTRIFSGTPTAANLGTTAVKASATDPGGLSASETFNMTVSTTAPPELQPVQRLDACDGAGVLQ